MTFGAGSRVADPYIKLFMLRFFILTAASGISLLGLTTCATTAPRPTAPVAAAASAPTSNALHNTFNYNAYTVVDLTEGEPPTEVQGVGGTLTLRPDGSYAKRLTITRPGSAAMHFDQDGRYTVTGDSIRFAFTDSKGADVQRGTYRLNPQTQALTITILGYPTGNRGIYELLAQPAGQ